MIGGYGYVDLIYYDICYGIDVVKGDKHDEEKDNEYQVVNAVHHISPAFNT